MSIGGTISNVKQSDRQALNGQQLQQVMLAAQHSMVKSGVDVSPSKVTNLARKFAKELSRRRISFHQFMANEADRDRFYDCNPGLRCLRGYLDPTGQIAVSNVERERRSREHP